MPLAPLLRRRRQQAAAETNGAVDAAAAVLFNDPNEEDDDDDDDDDYVLIPAPQQVAVDERLDALPPHVMHALRHPHIWWAISASIIRRSWLRPVAPIVMSPLVALYCRARRQLKKRGVARRGWACSLCHRRARWKCVRCMRSYYCSRQCQNVAWHIIHKHVCYKPSRFYGSIVFYGLAVLLVMPGMLRDPLFYGLGVLLIPASFIVVAVLVGGLATLLRKVGGVDLRGRHLEWAVVLLTAWLSTISIGLWCGFFHSVLVDETRGGGHQGEPQDVACAADLLLVGSYGAALFVYLTEWVHQCLFGRHKQDDDNNDDN
jgi:hypothetical protein